MKQNALTSKEEVAYYFTRSPIKFQDHTDFDNVKVTHNERFRTVTPEYIHRWLWNDAQSLK